MTCCCRSSFGMIKTVQEENLLKWEAGIKNIDKS